MAEQKYYVVIYLKGLSSPKIRPIMAYVSKDFRLKCVWNVANRGIIRTFTWRD
jgi:hypothetical protein